MASKTDKDASDDDDWETDPDYVNDVSEQTQRWGGRQREAGRILFKPRLINILNQIAYGSTLKYLIFLQVLLIWINFEKIF